VLTLIQHVSKACEAWELLRNQYETTNPTRILNLENQLQSEKLADGEAVDLFLTRIKGLRDQMAAIGMPLRSEDLARRCLRALPPKFDGFVTALTTAVRPTPLTFEEFSSMVMEEEMRLKVRSSADEAYAASAKGKGKSKDSGESSDRKKKMKCFYCGKKGHMAKECRKKQSDAKNGTLKKPESANAANTTEVELFIAVEESCSMATHDDAWIIDSGASRHMTSHNDWYTSLRPTGDE
jgi:hypothetical protein